MSIDADTIIRDAVRLAAECVRVYMYYARGCSDASALMEAQRQQQGESDSAPAWRIAAEREQLMKELHTLCTVDFPGYLRRESAGAGGDRAYLTFFRNMQKELTAHTTVLRSWNFDTIEIEALASDR